jgi:hypothetical protein
MASTREQTMERAATLWAVANLIETGEIAVDVSTSAFVNLDDDAQTVVPSLSVVIQRLGDRLFDTTYPDDLSEGEREEWFYSFEDAAVSETVDAIRIASLEDGLASA